MKGNEKCDQGSNIQFCENCEGIKEGYECLTNLDASSCSPIQGDGIRVSPENCDDGNLVKNDGCEPDGKFTESGFDC